MKKHYQFLALALSLFVAVPTQAQTQATSNPVGYITVTVPAGAVSAPSYTTLSIPLNNAAVFSGTVATVDSATQVTLNGAAWTDGQYITTPHLARVTSGANVGRFFLITGNTTNQLTVSLAHVPTITTLVGTLTAGDSVSIVPANTIGSILERPPRFMLRAPVLHRRIISSYLMVQGLDGELTFIMEPIGEKRALRPIKTMQSFTRTKVFS